MTSTKKNYNEILPRDLLIDIVERIASYSLRYLMNVKFKVLNQITDEPSVYQKYDFFNPNDSNELGMNNQAYGGRIRRSYVLVIISIFNGGESMREVIIFIVNMKKSSH
ncbi:hypothetical protein EJD97_005309 [Solanum chilense]|uniref:Uncharacterized protein n=1 Tax=Solanum chilense TaxID=4083 RepID=A0A6N2CEV1_SOLCI|nr:hypothetical protein EJD97_005309 [Solanum chilense]